MEKTLIFGHKNPDTDSICSALAYAELKKKLGENVEAVCLGTINPETQYALDYFKINAPRRIETAANEVNQVILVDHNERQQSISDIQHLKIIEVIDHHRIANFETSHPLYYRAETVGCTATILNKLFKEHQVTPSSLVAGLMLSAIISDSLLFKSPTCTHEDVAAAKELAMIAGIDAEQYGLQMLKAGADLSTKSVDQLLGLDAKEFQMGAAKVEIAQVNTFDLQEVLLRQREIEQAIQKIISSKSLQLFMFVITDILENDSVAICLGSHTPQVEKAYHVILENNRALLKGVVSRKLQIIPVLTEAIQSSFSS
jgi:manganese-dependent inorganic pyrophosphatase